MDISWIKIIPVAYAIVSLLNACARRSGEQMKLALFNKL